MQRGYLALACGGGVMTITEATAVNTLWDQVYKFADTFGCDEWIAFRTLAKSAHRALSAGVSPKDVETRALRHHADIRDEKPIWGAR